MHISLNFKNLTFSAIILAITTLMPLSVFAQDYSKMSYSLVQKVISNERAGEQVALFVKGDIKQIKTFVQSVNGTVKYNAGNICSITIPKNKIIELAFLSGVERMEDNDMKIELMNDRMLANNGVTAVHLGITPLGNSYKGKDVVVGIIDTGIDFTHPDFKDLNGKTRIKYIWDHNLPPGANSPFPYNYGEEFNDSLIDNNLANAHYDRINGHGTHVAGIAGGNGIAVNNYTGVAPESDLIIVSLDFNLNGNSWLTSVADAVSYIFDKANALGKPCVINISAGTYFGSHDGRDLQAQVIDNLITQQNGRAVVCAAGNAGNIPIHLRNNVNSDTTFTWFDFTSSSIVIDMWADTADLNQVQFAIGADKATPDFSFRGRTDFTNIQNHIGMIDSDTIYNGVNRIAVVQYFGQLIDDKYLMSCNIIPDSTTYLFRLMATGNGMFDVWSFEMVASNLPLPATFPDIVNYVTPDLEQNIVSSFACSDEVITVAQYINRNWYTDVNSNIVTFPTIEGAIADGSSKGPTRDGRIKPDIAATGDATLSCADLSSIPWFLANQPFKLAAGGKHIRDGGTSSASPVVAGIVALLFEQTPSASNSDIKNALLACVKTDAFTGYSLPDNTWGYGKVDAFKVLTNCMPVGMEENITLDKLVIFPNPAFTNSEITISSLEEISSKNLKIELRNITGQIILEQKVNAKNKAVKLTNQSAGVYFIRLFANDVFISSTKLVILD